MTLPPDIGLPSQIYPEQTLAAVFELLAPRAGLVEIDSFGLHTVLSPRNRRDAVASGLRLTVHGPYGFDIDPGSRDEALRRQAVAVHRRHIEAAAEMGALLYVAHPDYVEPPAPRDPAIVEAWTLPRPDGPPAGRSTARTTNAAGRCPATARRARRATRRSGRRRRSALRPTCQPSSRDRRTGWCRRSPPR